MHRFYILAVFIIALMTSPGLTYAEKRVALVIGNGAYGSIGALPNPPNDARLMAGTLRELGFEVIEKIDASQKTMKRAVRDFGTLLQNGGDDVVGLFFYAGHGVQVKGANYIIPVDAQIDKEGDVDIEAIDANSVMAMMEHSGAGLNFVILDACRNNPFSRGFRSATRGLAEMDAPTGSFIAYATSPGDVAADGDGANSPYTMALAKAMLKPGVSVERMFRNVRNDVRAMTNNDQTPWESSSLIGDDFFFNTASSPAIATTSDSTTMQQNSLTPEMLFWQSIQNSTEPAMFEAYLSQYPTGSFAALARVKLSTLSQTQVANVNSNPKINNREGLRENADGKYFAIDKNSKGVIWKINMRVTGNNLSVKMNGVGFGRPFKIVCQTATLDKDQNFSTYCKPFGNYRSRVFSGNLFSAQFDTGDNYGKAEFHFLRKSERLEFLAFKNRSDKFTTLDYIKDTDP